VDVDLEALAIERRDQAVELLRRVVGEPALAGLLARLGVELGSQEGGGPRLDHPVGEDLGGNRAQAPALVLPAQSH
jgi:hypothetical protein